MANDITSLIEFLTVFRFLLTVFRFLLTVFHWDFLVVYWCASTVGAASIVLRWLIDLTLQSPAPQLTPVHYPSLPFIFQGLV